MRARTIAAATAPLIVLLAACSTTTDTAAPEPTNTPSAANTPTPAAPEDSENSQVSSEGAEASAPTDDGPPLPQVGECFNDDERYTGTNIGEPVECEPGNYTKKTLGVLEYESEPPISYPEIQTVLDRIDKTYPDIDEADRQLVLDFGDWQGPLGSQCRELVRDAIGTQPNQHTMFEQELTGPTQEQWDAGQRWMRCNIVKIASGDEVTPEDTLLPLPEKLDNLAQNLNSYECNKVINGKTVRAECGTAILGDSSWMELLDGIPITEAGEYPGSKKKASRAVIDVCMDKITPYVDPERLAEWADDPQAYVASVYTHPTWNSVREGRNFKPKDVWAAPDGYFSCEIPHWAFEPQT